MNLEWQDLAGCRGMNTDLFFTTKTGRGAHREVQAAISVCRECPVTKRCKEYADATGSRDGVWGGHVRSASA